VSRQHTLSPLALEVAACLPVDDHGASIPELARDCFDATLVPGAVDLATPKHQRHRLVRNAIQELKRTLPRAVGDDEAIRSIHHPGAPPGTAHRYVVSRKSICWIKLALGNALKSPIQAT